MRISVVIPAFNSAGTIIDAIRSVELQELSDDVEIEVIVVNDGSEDDLIEKIDDYLLSSKLNLRLINKDNGGVSTARNTGIRQSSGDWIAFLDADDVWLPLKLQKQIDLINLKDDINFIGCARNNEQLSILFNRVNDIYVASCMDLLIKMFPQTSTALVKKVILDEVGYYNETMTHSEDGELWLRIATKGGFYYLPESLVVTGGGKDNYGDSGLSSNLKKMHLGTVKMLQTAYDLKIISKVSYFGFKFFYFLKYVRRIVIVRMRSLCSSS
ncbi:glycosyltransferase family 2 protein [Vibrio parahaemolyticus]|uniref:Putative glycosyltransferase EpsJ n=1 Tax=Vibrio parahaemolyticus TaxID=670 RepID=A0A7M1W574_VIBPH|nr:glycosyltransferase family A protein [Vibrio parahaemolyticus]QOS22012.1 putative glycosyltransferase EpsJ [Vibrio parahaemolyticus]